MIGVENFDVKDTSEPLLYPNGCVLDDPIGVDGTMAEKNTWNDMILYFDKMLRMNGITANGLFDNEQNGYQSVEALRKFTCNYVALLVQSMLGSAYSTSVVYVLAGGLTETANGYVLYNNELFFLEGRTGAACLSPSVPILDILDEANLDRNLRIIKISCGTSGSGIADFSNVVYLNNNWTNVNTFGAGIASSTDSNYTTQYNKINHIGGIATVSIRGRVRMTLGSAPATPTTLLTLPAGFRPSKNLTYLCYTDSSVASGVAIIEVLTTGVVRSQTTLAVGTVALDLSPVRFEV